MGIAENTVRLHPTGMTAHAPPRFTFDASGNCVVEGAREACRLIGPDLFAAFLKCFRGADQLLSLEQMLHFCQQQQDQDSAPYERNLQFIVEFLASTMYELRKALDDLLTAGIESAITNPALWEPINTIRCRWQGDARLAKVRNNLGFHLGDIEMYRTGMKELLGEDDTLVFERLDGTKRHDGRNLLATGALLRGVGLSNSDFAAIAKITQDGHFNLPDHLHALFADVLEKAGVERPTATS
jgi:hypothetical protein